MVYPEINLFMRSKMDVHMYVFHRIYICTDDHMYIQIPKGHRTCHAFMNSGKPAMSHGVPTPSFVLERSHHTHEMSVTGACHLHLEGTTPDTGVPHPLATTAEVLLLHGVEGALCSPTC